AAFKFILGPASQVRTMFKESQYLPSNVLILSIAIERMNSSGGKTQTYVSMKVHQYWMDVHNRTPRCAYFKWGKHWLTETLRYNDKVSFFSILELIIDPPFLCNSATCHWSRRV